jgi:ABC-2 type transport system permease protein
MPIFDQGYQHWKGPLSGHAWRWLAIVRHGVRVQGKNLFLRLLLLLAWLPALALVAAVAVWGLVEQQSATVLSLARALLPADILLDPHAYRTAVWTVLYSFFFKTEMFFIMLLVVVAGPGLISRDLRFNALPLYFSRPLTRLDYLLGKLGVIGVLVAAVAVGPAVFAYVVGVCFSLDFGVVKDTYPLLLASVIYGLVITLSVGTLILAMSCLSRRSLYVGIAWGGLWLISGSVGSILTAFHHETLRQELVKDEMARWVEKNPPPEGIQMHGPFPVFQPRHGKHRPAEDDDAPALDRDAERWFQAWAQANQQAVAEAQPREAEARRADWRPLCSYVANLERIGDQLLDTDSAWVTFGKAAERSRAALEGGPFGMRGGNRARPPVNERRLADELVPQYPWIWSAGVLAGLLGLCTWILTRRIQSLDRLK